MHESGGAAGAVITSRDDLVEVLRARKDELGLSNSYIEAALHMAEHGCDKILGPSRIKGLSWPVAFDLAELLGGKLVFQLDPAIEARMRERWEKRDSGKVHPSNRVSKTILARAAPLLFAALGRAGGTKRAECLTAKQRKEIARAAAHSRWRLHRAAVKARAIAETAA